VVDAHGDHRIAMAAAVAALAAAGPVTVNDWQAVATSYPGFEEDLRSCVS
jgi:3-phosphoshikimate 1-carboxyvinyltransferase